MQSIQLKVCLYGNTANYDRKFNIEVYSDTDTLSAIEGVDFKAFATEYVMSANQAETSYWYRFIAYRRPDKAS